jgi:hypothetical protein
MKKRRGKVLKRLCRSSYYCGSRNSDRENPMKTEAHLEPTAIFPQRVIAAVSELKVEIGSLPRTSAFLRITSRRISCSTSVESKAEKAKTIDGISLMKNIGTSVKVFLANKLWGDANGRETSTSPQDVYEVCPRKNQDGFDLISDRLPYGPIWYAGPDAIRYAAAYAKYHSWSQSRRAIIRVLDELDATVCIAKSVGDFRE